MYHFGNKATSKSHGLSGVARVAELGGQAGGMGLYQGASVYARPEGWTPYIGRESGGHKLPPETDAFQILNSLRWLLSDPITLIYH